MPPREHPRKLEIGAGMNGNEATGGMKRGGPDRRAESDSIYRNAWINWFMLAGVLLLTTFGLITALPPLLSARIANPWPWVKTDLVLLIGLSATVLLFVTYLTMQQRQVMRMHRDIQKLKLELEERIVLHTRRLSALSEISHTMGAETDLRVIFDRITRTCMEKFASARASLMLYDKERRELVVESIWGPYEKNIMKMRCEIDSGIAGWVARNGKPLLLNGPEDVANYPELKLKDSSTSSAIVVPITVRNELVGVLNVSRSPEGTRYEIEDLFALQIFAQNAGSCIRHAEQINWMRQMVPRLNGQPQKS